ncbi:2-isopropylmalate synthase [Vagococcus sp. JNUCC 83]
MKTIQFFDTSLRDGEQTPGVNFNTAEKVRIAKQLESYGIDAIEAGFPITSPGDFEAVTAIAKAAKKMTVVGLARCRKKDIDAAYEALKHANHPQIHVFLATSDIHMTHKLHMTEEEVLSSIKEHVTYAKTLFEKVQFSPEDATRTEKEFLVKAIQTAIDAGATIINVPDTVGYSNPTEYGELFKYITSNCQNIDHVIFSCHCHNDLGMATANALAAIENGAGRVEGTINGIGERAGNTAIEEVALALHIRKDFYHVDTNIKLEQTKMTSDLISRLSGIPIHKTKPIIGGNAFAHESGIHQDGVLKHPDTYEIMTPQLIGLKTNHLPLGKLSGSHAFGQKLIELGYTNLTAEEQQTLFEEFKVLADKKKNIVDRDIHALVAGNAISTSQSLELKNLQLQFTSNGQQAAVIEIETADNDQLSDSATGNGSIQAIYNTINRIMDKDVQLGSFRIESLTSGEDAQAEVHVEVYNPETGESVHGVGIDFDILTASAKAYINAFSKLKEGESND